MRLKTTEKFTLTDMDTYIAFVTHVKTKVHSSESVYEEYLIVKLKSSIAKPS
jgi:hypothetical protein